MAETTVTVLPESDGEKVFLELKSSEIRMVVSTLGGRIISLYTKDRQGQMGDIVLALEDTKKDYLRDGRYLGVLVGRVANRIGDSCFDLGGKTYQVIPNEGKNQLHGGPSGFDKKVLKYEIVENGVKLYGISYDGEEGFPGTMEFSCTYLVKGNQMSLVYDAVCDKDTLVNLTNHSFFNFTGCKDTILKHSLKVNADKIANADSGCLTDGTFLDVEGTPFDFREFHEIGERIEDDHIQLKYGQGYDHAYVLNGNDPAVVLYEETTGREMSISTDLPSVQVYAGNCLAGGLNGKIGRPYEKREGIALETQFLPNSIHIEKDSPTILKAGEKYHSATVYTFTAR